VVVATDGDAAETLVPGAGQRQWRSTITLYYASSRPPITEGILVLDGDGTGPVNHLAVPSAVAPGYAPEGQSLIACNIVTPGPGSDAEIDAAVRAQMTAWFGADAVESWRLLRLYRIAHALPNQFAPALEPATRSVQPDPTRPVFVCGDHRDNASINGAMASGRRAAAAVLASLGK
jgi:protoporphyrinogen oxidase